jgi:glycosyltransferase involved in cell wall biosynthesis
VLRIAIDYRDAAAARPGGWGRYTRELVAALRAGGEVEVIALTGGRGGPEVAWEQAGLPLAAARRGADVLHAPNCFLPLRRGGRPGVVTVHDLAFEVFPEDFAARTRAKYRWITPRAARSAERVIAVSAFTRDDLCDRYGVDPARVRVVPNAPALAGAAGGVAGPPAGATPGVAPASGFDEPYLLGVGDLRAKKNWGRLVAAWRTLRAAGLPHRLVIAGADAGQGPALRAAAGGEPLELPGYVPDDRLDALMRGAEALVHPSLYEGFGLVVLEAQARGCPVAIASGTALPEAGGDAAVLFDPRDTAAIAAAIEDVLARREELAARGRRHAARFSWAATAAATVAVYREAASA